MLHRCRSASPFVFVLLAWSTVLVACDSGSAVDPGRVTALRIETVPGEVAGAWRLAGPAVSPVTGSGDTLITSLEPGTWWLLFEPVPGRHSPADNPREIVVEPGRTAVATATWLPIAEATGTVVIEAPQSAASPRWNLQGPASFFAAGEGAAVLRGRAPGTYSVVWDRPVEGVSQGEPAVLEPGGLVAFRPTGTQADPGGAGLAVDPNPDWIDAPWELTLPDGSTISARGDTLLTGLPLGTCTLRWSAVAGFVQPESLQAELDPWTVARVATTYRTPLHPVGTMHVRMQPEGIDAAWAVVSDAGFVASGSGDTTIDALTEGDYTVVWAEVPGYRTPPEISRRLEAGSVVLCEAGYVPADPARGTIRVDASPDSLAAGWRIVASTGLVYTGFGDSTLVDLPPGTYTLTWADVEGFSVPAPNPVSGTLAGGTTVSFGLP